MPQKIELKVGMFLIITSLLIAAAIGYVAYKKGFFAKVYTYTLSSKSGEDLTEGMPVVFSGFNIGTVQTLELSDDGTVLIKIKIPERHVKWIRSDSTFIVNKPLIGSARIVVVTENLKSAMLSTRQIQEVVNVSDINETIKKAQPLLDKVNKIASNIEALTTNIADPKGDVHKILAHSEQLTANLAQKKSFLEMAISDKESLDSIYATLKQTKDITAQVENILKKVDMMAGKTDDMVYGKEGALPTIIKALKDVLAKLEKLDTTIGNINKISNEAADSAVDLKALRAQIDDAVTSISELARELEAKLPFKKTPEIKLP
ncbi:MAG: MlaD family protein [Syntrophales bacterium LBB04]|nr:MlaD family protein [Syntrophales bacterium LBB04]